MRNLNIEIGKTYMPFQILEKVNRYPNLEFKFGHIFIEDPKRKRHEYFVDKEFIKSLKNPLKIYNIMTIPTCQNFACRLLQDREVREILNQIEKDNKLICILNEEDLAKAKYNYKSFKKAISLINRVLKANNMPFRALSHPEGIKVVHRKIKEKVSV